MAKLAITGGGRCNLTNDFQGIRSLSEAYPRGERVMKRALKAFSQEDTIRWFTGHGVPCVLQEDHCWFPKSQDALDVVRCLERALKGAELRLKTPVISLDYQASAVPTAEKNYFLQGFAKNQFSSAEIVVLEGSAYQISAATFPTYFLKDLSDAAQTQMLLDLDLYTRWIAPALNASVRFVGSEPLDALTNHYNTLMREVLPIEVVEIPRLKYASTGDKAEENYFSQGFAKNQFSSEISASYVRKALEVGDFAAAAVWCPRSSWPYLLAQLAQRALTMELNLPLKPGLVCPDSNGAHKDMDYALMQRGIAAIRPFFAPMAMADTPETLRQLGIEAEMAMMAATGGVNTHRGAIFCLGLALNAWMQGAHNEELMQNRLAETAQSIFRIQLSDSG